MPHLACALALLLAACAEAPDPAPLADPAPAAPTSTRYEAVLTALLQAVVSPDGRVDYARLGREHGDDFAAVLAAVERYDPAALTTDEQKLAFFLNAYNVRMLKHILDAPEVDHIERAGRFDAFFRRPVRVAGLDLTLNQLEHGVLRRRDVVDGAPLPEALRALRPSALDPRLHVGLNCAAVSCPALRREAFTAEHLDAQLDDALAAFADDARFATVSGGAVVLTRLLDWFGEDFDAAGPPAGDYFLAVMSPERPGYAAIRPILAGRAAAAIRTRVAGDPNVTFFYDWTVNRP
jgi:hypothetical protein